MELRYNWQEAIIISTAFAGLSGSLAKLFLVAQKSELLNSIIFSGLAWSSYVVIHYVETGVIIDSRENEKVLPEGERNWLYLALSTVFFSIGMIFGAHGVSNQRFIQSTIGAAILLLGYFIAHFEFSDNIV